MLLERPATSGRCPILQELPERIHDLARILSRNHSTADLAGGLGGDDGLGARSRVAGPDAVEIARRPRPDPLQHTVSMFSDGMLKAGGGEEPLLVEIQRSPFGEKLLVHQDIVVETLYLDSAMIVVELADDPGQRVDRVDFYWN